LACYGKCDVQKRDMHGNAQDSRVVPIVNCGVTFKFKIFFIYTTNNILLATRFYWPIIVRKLLEYKTFPKWNYEDSRLCPPL
jgi:hypothetical protein